MVVIMSESLMYGILLVESDVPSVVVKLLYCDELSCSM